MRNNFFKTMDTKIELMEQAEELKAERVEGKVEEPLKVYEVKTLEEAELEDGTKVQVVKHKEQFNEVELQAQINKIDAEIEALQARITELQTKRINLTNLTK